jgi:hypothetical protein
MKRIFHTYPPKWELDEADDFTANPPELSNQNSVIATPSFFGEEIQAAGMFS